MALFDVILGIVEQTWELSAAVIPVVFVLFFALYLIRNKEDTSYRSVFVSSQRDMVLQYGIYLITGLVFGGAVGYVFTGDGVFVGSLVTAAIAAYGLQRKELPEPANVPLDSATDYIHLVWVAVPFLAVLAVFSAEPILQRFVALIFYATIFWEI